LRGEGSASRRGEDTAPYLRWLIWTYFWLLIFEGALRKWALPSLANPLLVIRDPVLLAIYGLAFARQIFPINKFVIALTLHRRAVAHRRPHRAIREPLELISSASAATSFTCRSFT
jgi:hypothetical protein